MTGEPLSAQQVRSQPPVAFEHINLAERFGSFAEYAAFTESSPQPGAASLDVARLHAFTGELTVAIEPAVRLYLDGGTVYYAERHGGPSVAELMLDAEVLDTVQLQRGVVRVGDVDHLGRLFDRDATVDRDAVMVVVEGATDSLVQKVAGSVVATVAASAYRHHPSGLHRWFVGPGDVTTSHRPASGVMQIDRTVVDELPQLGTPSEPASVDRAVEAELERFDADRADWAASSIGTDHEVQPGTSHDDFHVVWPDGSRDLAGTSSPTAPPHRSVAPPAAPIEQATPVVEHAPTEQPASAVQEASHAAPPVPEEAGPPVPEDVAPPVPEDVAAAVRRALQALGSDSTHSNEGEPVDQPRALTLPDASFAAPVGPSGPAAPNEPEPMGFPPPTLETSAAAIYARAAAAAASAAVASGSTPAPAAIETPHVPPRAAPEQTTPSAVADDDATARRGALRRLIGSLRAKD